MDDIKLHLKCKIKIWNIKTRVQDDFDNYSQTCTKLSTSRWMVFLSYQLLKNGCMLYERDGCAMSIGEKRKSLESCYNSPFKNFFLIIPNKP